MPLREVQCLVEPTWVGGPKVLTTAGKANGKFSFCRSGKLVLKYRRLLSRTIVLGALGVIIWTPFTTSVAQQSGRAFDNAAKGTEQTASQGHPDTGKAPILTRGGAIVTEFQTTRVLAGEAATTEDINAELAAISRKLDELLIIPQKLHDAEAAIEPMQQILPNPGPATPPTQSEWPRWEFWMLAILNIAALSILVVLAMRAPPRERGSNRAQMRPYPHAPERTNPVELLLPKLQEQSRRTEEVVQTLGQLRTTLLRLATDFENLPALIAKELPHSRLREAPAEPVSVLRKPISTAEHVPSPRDVPVSSQLRAVGNGSPPSSKIPRGPVPGPQLDAHAASILSDFRQIVSDDSNTRSFLDRWHPQSVVMANFEQRVRESGISPELVVRNSPIGSADEHFWFVSPTSSQFGYILPARRLLLHRSALRGEGASKLFRQIFEMNSSDTFNVEQPAFAALEGERVRIIQQGAIALPY